MLASAEPASACSPRFADTTSSYVYVSSTNATFVFNLTAVTAQAATSSCHWQSGQLVTYASLEEQAEVEQHFVNMGIFLQRYGCCANIRLSRPLLQDHRTTVARSR